jgi:cell division protein FtsW (lipid II flippase)
MASTSKDVYYNSVEVVKKAMVAVIALSVLYMLCVQCFPRIMNRVAVVAGIVCLIGLAVCLIIRPTEGSSDLIKWIAFGITAFILIVVICTFAGNWRSWGLNGVFL